MKLQKNDSELETIIVDAVKDLLQPQLRRPFVEILVVSPLNPFPDWHCLCFSSAICNFAIAMIAFSSVNPPCFSYLDFAICSYSMPSYWSWSVREDDWFDSNLIRARVCVCVFVRPCANWNLKSENESAKKFARRNQREKRETSVDEKYDRFSPIDLHMARPGWKRRNIDEKSRKIVKCSTKRLWSKWTNRFSSRSTDKERKRDRSSAKRSTWSVEGSLLFIQPSILCKHTTFGNGVNLAVSFFDKRFSLKMYRFQRSVN